LDKAIVDIAKEFKEAFLKIGVCTQQLSEVTLQHEQRLQKLEEPDIKCELKDVQRYIVDLQDPQKKEAALAEFAALCNALGIEDLEA